VNSFNYPFLVSYVIKSNLRKGLKRSEISIDDNSENEEGHRRRRKVPPLEALRIPYGK